MTIYRKGFTSTYDIALVSAAASFGSTFASPVQGFTGFPSTFAYINKERFSFGSTYEAPVQDTLRFGFGSSFVVEDAYPAIVVSSPKTVIKINDHVVACSKFEISIDESSYGYSIKLELADPNARFNRDDVITVTIGADTYRFLVDSVNRGESGEGAPVSVIRGISPIFKYDTPRAEAISLTVTTPTTASTVVTSLLGAVKWDLVDWVIPEYRLAVENRTPLTIAKDVVTSAGGVIVADKVGNLTVTHAYPVATNKYESVTPSLNLNAIEHILTLNEEGIPNDGINSLVLTDLNEGATTEFSDSMEFSATDSTRGTLTVYPSPVRPLSVKSTASESLDIVPILDGSTITKEDYVEIYQGEGNVSYPISSITSVEHVSIPVTGLAYTQGSTSLHTTDPNVYGIVKVKYRTKAMQYSVAGVTSPKVQFLLVEK